MGRPLRQDALEPVTELEAGRRSWRELGLLAQNRAPVRLLVEGDPRAAEVWSRAREIAVRRGLVGPGVGARLVRGDVVDGCNELLAVLDELGVPREWARSQLEEHHRLHLRAQSEP